LKLLKHVVTLFLSIFFTLVLLEGVVRVVLHYQSYYDIEMWKYGTRLKRKALDPNMSHEHVPLAKAKLYGVDIDINSKGLRDREISYDKPANTFRVMFLGDSLTLGWGVKNEYVFSKVLEPVLEKQKGKSVEVINTGVGNYNTVQEWTYYKLEGRKYKPDHLMLLYFINDAEPTPEYKSITLKENSTLVVFLWSRITKLMSRFGARKDFRSYYEGLYEESNPGWKASKEALSSLMEQAKQDGTPFTVFVCPELRQFKSSYPFMVQHKKILSYLTGNGIQYADLLPLFQKRTEPEEDFWVSVEDSHPNRLGHQVIAEGVVNYFSELQKKEK
jgi:lysophospholipase L1-like esterase